MKQPYTAISLFSGAVDGLAIAAQAAGIKVTHHVEWDSWCCRVLRMNHPGSIVINEDIHNVKDLPYADVVMGGSPCQDFSGAGKQAGFDGERYLWPEMRRIVGECRPRVVIHENVRGGVSLGLLDKICSDLESDGYEVWPLVYPAAIFGAPHERYRMFHIGLLADAEPHGRPEQGTITDARTNEQWNVSSFELSRGTVSNAAESSGQDVADAQHNGHIAPALPGCNAPSIHNSTEGQNRTGQPEGSNSPRIAPLGAVEHPNSQQPQKHDLSRRGNGQGFIDWGFDPDRSRDRLPQPVMGGIAHGIAPRLPRLNPLEHFPGFPAGQGSYQYPYEPPRTTPEKGEYAKEQIQALGNSVLWQQAAPIMRTVVRWLEGQDAS